MAFSAWPQAFVEVHDEVGAERVPGLAPGLEVLDAVAF